MAMAQLETKATKQALKGPVDIPPGAVGKPLYDFGMDPGILVSGPVGISADFQKIAVDSILSGILDNTVEGGVRLMLESGVTTADRLLKIAERLVSYAKSHVPSKEYAPFHKHNLKNAKKAIEVLNELLRSDQEGFLRYLGGPNQ